MHHCDIAAKVLIDICRDEILRRFLHLRLIRLYEMNAREAVEHWPTCLLPLFH